MKCPFCSSELIAVAEWDDTDNTLVAYQCNVFDCRVYTEVINSANEIVQQEYGIGNFIVKVFPNSSLIYNNTGLLLEDCVKIRRALWLDKKDIDTTLTKIKMLLLFS